MAKVVTLEKWLQHSARPNVPVTTVVLHHTGGATAQSTIDYLRPKWSAKLKVWLGKSASYHFIVERDGTVYKCVPLAKKAWHAGSSKGPDGKDVNRYSVGIAFANRGNGEEYPDEQIVSAGELVRSLKSQFPELAYITTHRLITKRKVDPAYFDFISFADGHTGLTTWMDPALNRGWNG